MHDRDNPSLLKTSPVRLKEFPKAENELRGVKSGLLGLLAGLHKPELSEPSLSTGVCEMPRLLEKSVLFEETLAKPFPPGLLSYPAVTAAKVGLPFLPGSEAAFVNLCLLPFGCLVLGSLLELLLTMLL